MNNDELDGYRLSPQQERMWRLGRSGNACVYRSQAAVVIKGRLDLDSIRDAIALTVDRHEILRSRFRTLDGMNTPVQFVEPDGGAGFNRLDLSDFSEPEQRDEIDSVYRQALKRTPEYGRGETLHVTLVRLSEDRHAMVLTAGAMCCDATSVINIISDIAGFYEQSEAELPPAIQYADASAVFNQLVESVETKAGRDHWLGWDRSQPKPMGLPWERTALLSGEFSLEELPVEIDEHLATSVESFARQRGVDEGVVYLAGWFALLGRLIEDGPVTVGVSCDGRTFEGLTGAVGPYARVLPISLEPVWGSPYSDLLTSVATSAAELRKWQNYFSGKPSRQIESTGRDSHDFPFQFEYQTGIRRRHANDLEIEITSLYACSEKFKVKLHCRRSEEKIDVRFVFDGWLYDQAEMRLLCGQYQRIVEASVLGTPEAGIVDLDLLSDCERDLLLSAFNDTARDYETRVCLHAIAARKAASIPDAIAVVSGSEHLSNGELDEEAGRLAKSLRSIGVGPETTVAVFLERSIEMVASLLGILKAGGAYVPIDPEYPSHRVKYMLDDSRASVLITQQRLASGLPANDARVLIVGGERSPMPAGCVEIPAGNLPPEILMCVIYTSGTTGNPKGAMLSHAGVRNCIDWMQETYRMDESDRFLAKTSLNFDPSIWEIFWPLCVGATVVLAGPQDHRDPGRLVELIARHQVTAAYFVPSLLRTILAETGAEIRSLRRVICGGESISPDLVDEFFNKIPCDLHHSYGPTETSIAATEYTCAPGARRRVIPIGTPLGNTSVYIVDSAMRLSAIGVRGSLYVGGAAVGRGYLGRPGLTAERFTPDWLNGSTGARFYQTGDLCRYWPDGNIEFLGRKDNQIKIRGFRIELGEIENALIHYEGLNEAAVLVKEAASGEKLLAAYLVPEAGYKLEIAKLRESLRLRLPDYMLPSEWIMIEMIPRTPGGKLDASALRAIAANKANAASCFDASRNVIEDLVTEIWCDVLNRERIGIHQNFFEIGGHSLVATRLVLRIREAFKIELSLREVFESPTVAGLSETIDVALKREALVEAPRIVRVSRDSFLPLSFAQQRLWFLEQLDGNRGLYNVPLAVRMKGALIVRALERTISDIIKRHEALRTVFPSVDGEPMQVVKLPAAIVLPLIDLSGLAGDDADAEAIRIWLQRSREPFDLAEGPLIRLNIVKLDTDDHVVMVTMHHIISDAWSMGILMNEVTQLYKLFANGTRVSELEELNIQYCDFAAWQRESMQGQVFDNQLEYWRRKLSGELPVLPLTKARTSGSSALAAGVHSLRLDKVLSDRLRSLSRSEGATLYMTMLAAFKALLYRWSGQEDIIVGAPIAGRNTREVEGLIGCFINTLVLRTDLSGDPTFRDLLRRVRETALGAYAHQDVPFEMLVKALKPERQMSRAPIFQVVFTFQNAPTRSQELPGLALTEWGPDCRIAHFVLTMLVFDSGAELIASLEYDRAALDEAVVTETLKQYEAVLSHVVSNPDVRVNALELATAAEKERQSVDGRKRREFISRKLRNVKRTAVDMPAAVLGGESRAGLTPEPDSVG